jgi:hypothetical protein
VLTAPLRYSSLEHHLHNMPESTAYGEATVNGLLEKEHKPSAPGDTSEEDMQLVLQSFRLLIADLCQQFGMGMRFRSSPTTNTVY